LFVTENPKVFLPAMLKEGRRSPEIGWYLGLGFLLRVTLHATH